MTWSIKSCILFLLISIIIASQQIHGFSFHNKKKNLHIPTACINTVVEGSNDPVVEPANKLYTYQNIFDDISGYFDDKFPSDIGFEEGIYGEVLPSSLRSLFGDSAGPKF